MGTNVGISCMLKTALALLLLGAWGAEISAQSQWTIHPLLVAGDPLPRIKDAATFGDDTRSRFFVGDRVYFQDGRGIFLATRDTILAFVTELDTIPGTTELFEDLGDNGAMNKRGLHGFEIVDALTVAFPYVHAGRLLFCVATAGKGIQAMTLPDTVRVGTQTMVTGDGAGLRLWRYNEREGVPEVHILWYDFTIGFLENEVTSALFTFDGRTVKNVLARDDTIVTSRRVIVRSVGEDRFEGPRAELDPVSDRWMLQAVVRPWDSSSQDYSGEARCEILLMDRGGIHTVVGEDDTILNVRGGRLAKIPIAKIINGKNYDTWLWWQPDFERDRVRVFGGYKEGDSDWLQGFFAASKGGVERLASWRAGDSLPGTGGGRIESFTRLRHPDGRAFSSANDELFRAAYANPAGDTIISFVAVEGSRSDVREAIVRFEKGVLTTVVAENDSVYPTSEKTFCLLDEFFPLAGGKELIFRGLLKRGDRDPGPYDSGIFHYANGKVFVITSSGLGVIDNRRPGKKRAITFKDVYAFSVVNDKCILFSATQGYYLATRK